MGQISCSECGISFVVPDVWHQQRRDDGKSFYCPNGHGQCYNRGETKAQILQRELNRAKQNAVYLEEQAKYEREARASAERRAAAARGQVTKLKKHTIAGKCPCCRRNFSALSEHMRKQHPQFMAEAIDGDEIKTPAPQ